MKTQDSKYTIVKSNTIKLMELKFNIDIVELLRQDYLDNHMTINEMADKYEISPCTVHKWLKHYEIPRRKITFS